MIGRGGAERRKNLSGKERALGPHLTHVAATSPAPAVQNVAPNIQAPSTHIMTSVLVRWQLL
jgi:hypothetical protein